MVYSNQNENGTKIKNMANQKSLSGFIFSSKKKKIYNQPLDSNIKPFKEIINLTTGQGGDYITGCLLDYEYIKIHYRLIALDLSRHRELDHDSKAVKQKEFSEQLKKTRRFNSGVHLVMGGGGGSWGSGPLPFFDTVKFVASNSATSFEETLCKISLKNKRIDQNNVPTDILLRFFNTTLRRILKLACHQSD